MTTFTLHNQSLSLASPRHDCPYQWSPCSCVYRRIYQTSELSIWRSTYLYRFTSSRYVTCPSPIFFLEKKHQILQAKPSDRLHVCDDSHTLYRNTFKCFDLIAYYVAFVSIISKSSTRSHSRHGSTNLQQHQSQGISTSTNFHHQCARYTELNSPQGQAILYPNSQDQWLWLLRLWLPLWILVCNLMYLNINICGWLFLRLEKRGCILSVTQGFPWPCCSTFRDRVGPLPTSSGT